MKVIILAGGKGTRLPNSAKDIPKSLVEVNGKPMLEHQVDLLAQHGLHDLRFSLGFRADQVINYLNGRFEHVVETEPLGTGGALKRASQDLEEPFMALNGDIVGDMDLGRMLKRWEKVKDRKNPNMILVSDVEDAKDFGLLKLEGDTILRFFEKPSESRTGFINAGIYILSPESLRQYPEVAFSIENDIFPRLAERGNLYHFLHTGDWTDLGTEDRLWEARE